MKPIFQRIDKQLEFWIDIVKKYPLSDAYKRIVFDLQQQRADEASKIGRKATKS